MERSKEEDKKIALTKLLAGYANEELPMFAGVDLTSANSSGPGGDTPLHLACYRGSLEDAALLLDAGADVNAVGDMKRRPIHEAIAYGPIELVRLLLERGASLEFLDGFDASAIDLAQHRGDEEIRALVSRAIEERRRNKAAKK